MKPGETGGKSASGKLAGGKVDEAAPRHVYGPRSLAALLPDLLRPALRRRSPAAAHLIAEWESIVGPAIAAISQPRRLFAGTLSIAAAGPVALEMQHLAPVLIERINTHLGGKSVGRLRFVQDFAAAPPAPLRLAPPPQAADQAAARVAHLPDGPLRDALERLGRVVLAHPISAAPRLDASP